MPLHKRTRDEWDAYFIHHPPPNPQAVVDIAAAHLHIDLLPRLQGQGVGKRLMDTWLEAVGGRAHLGCQAENHRAQRFYEGPLGFSFPMFFSGTAQVCEWYDDDTQKFRIDVNVSNRIWGPLFGYRGSFDARWEPVDAENVPGDVKPLREERRE